MDKFRIIFIIILSVQVISTTNILQRKPKWNATHADRLRHDLLLNYDKYSRPAQHFNTTKVKFSLSLYNVDIDEIKSSMTVQALLRLNWMDHKFIWNASDYGDLKVIHLADHEIWQPDIYIYNSATAQSINSVGSTYTLVHENGEVIWVPPAQFTVLCNIDLHYWPLDAQKCEVKFGSWGYHGNLVDLSLPDDRNETEMVNDLLFKNHKWNLTSSIKRVVAKYECCIEPYPSIVLNITMRRIPQSYKTIIITPAFAIIFLILIPFWLQPQAGEKIVIQGCTAIIICMFQFYFSQLLSAMGLSTPNIVLFYSQALYIVSFAIMTSVGVIWLARTPHQHPLPWKLKQILVGPFGICCLGLDHYIAAAKVNRISSEELRNRGDNGFLEENDIIASNTNNCRVNQNDWILLAAAIDRVAMVVYWIVLVVMGMSYML